MAFDDRTKILFGAAGVAHLAAARVCVVGLGGVGAACAMDLVRAGVGELAVMDFDEVQESNLNRLAFGGLAEVGVAKVDAFESAALSVNPAVRVRKIGKLMRGNETGDVVPIDYDFYIDAIDTLNPKVNLLVTLCERDVPFASAMGTAGRAAPERLRIGSVWATSGCPLAQKVRQRLRRRGVSRDFAVVWSDEPAVKPANPPDGAVAGTIGPEGRIRAVQGSGPFVPQTAGHFLASIAVRHLLGLPIGNAR